MMLQCPSESHGPPHELPYPEEKRKPACRKVATCTAIIFHVDQWKAMSLPSIKGEQAYLPGHDELDTQKLFDIWELKSPYGETKNAYVTCCMQS